MLTTGGEVVVRDISMDAVSSISSVKFTQLRPERSNRSQYFLWLDRQQNDYIISPTTAQASVRIRPY